MLRSKLFMLLVLIVTPLLVSPLVLRQEAMRGLASVGEVTLPAGFEGANEFSSLETMSDESRSAYNFFSDYLAAASLSYFVGLQAARGVYGLSGPVFSDPNPLALPKFDVTAIPGYTKTMWGGVFPSGQLLSSGLDSGVKAAAAVAPRAQIKQQTAPVPLPRAKAPTTRFGSAK